MSSQSFNKLHCISSCPVCLCAARLTFRLVRQGELSVWPTWGEREWLFGRVQFWILTCTGQSFSVPHTFQGTFESGRCCSCYSPASPWSSIHLLSVSEEREREREHITLISRGSFNTLVGPVVLFLDTLDPVSYCILNQWWMSMKHCLCLSYAMKHNGPVSQTQINKIYSWIKSHVH